MVNSKIRFKFKESAEYRHVTATGVFGGPISTGDLLCNFYLEYRILPEGVDISIDYPNQQRSEELIYPEGKDIIIREFQVGVIMNPRIAKSVGEWLIRRAEEMMAIQRPPIS
jgi:hypothetical protein